jgi:hypothetical protein
MAVVRPEERSAAAGMQSALHEQRVLAIAPVFCGIDVCSAALINVPFFLAGTLKSSMI